MWGLNHKLGLVLKNWCFYTGPWKTLESTLDSKEIKPINPKGNQLWLLEGLMLKLKLQYFDHWMQKSDSGKDPDAEKDWGQDEKGETECKMVGWHHWLSGYEFEQIPGDSKGQGNLVSCSPRDCKESDTT